VLAANSVALLCRLAEEGRGIALLPQHVAARSVQARRLVPVLAGESTPTWPLYAVTASRHVPTLVRLLIAQIKGALTPGTGLPRETVSLR
jgi:DNA-binding transcriptional LysR family regulator